jgi:hypothetical protein
MEVRVNFMPQSLYPWNGTPVPVEPEAVWTLETVWTFWGKQKFLAPTSIRTLNHSASQQPSSYTEYVNPASFEGRILDVIT